MSQFISVHANLKNGIAHVCLPNRPRILIACMPKTASTFLVNAVAAVPGIRMRLLSIGFERTEQQISHWKLVRACSGGFVAKHHVRYSKRTAKILERFNITPVVLTRNLFDVIVSMRDHVRRESFLMPMAFLTEQHVAMSDADLELALADLVAPWLINFYVGWLECSNAVRVTYDEVSLQPRQTLERIVRAAGLRPTEKDIERAVEVALERRRRFNVGISGRGNELRREAKEHILRLVSHYPKSTGRRFSIDSKPTRRASSSGS